MSVKGLLKSQFAGTGLFSKNPRKAIHISKSLISPAQCLLTKEYCSQRKKTK